MSGASNLVVERAPTLFVKVQLPPSRAPLVDSRHLALCEGVRRYGGPSGFLGSIVHPHRSNGDVPTPNMLVFIVTTFGYFFPLLCASLLCLYLLLSCVLVVVFVI